MTIKKHETVKQILYWSYSNLAMAHSALEKKQTEYIRLNFVIRSKLYKGLTESTMNIGSFYNDEKTKLATAGKCSYCGLNTALTIEHIIPKSKGGNDSGDNLIYICKKCNSSKGSKDLMAWMQEKNLFPPLMVLRRYLKLIINYSCEVNIMDSKHKDIDFSQNPYNIKHIPVSYPALAELVITAKSKASILD